MGVGMMQSKRRILMDTPHIVTPTAAELLTFSTDMMAPLRECRVHFSPMQASGIPSPDNPLQITGWTSLIINHTPRNIFPKVMPDDAIAGTFGTDSTSISSSTNGRVFSFYLGKNVDLHYSRTGSTLTVMTAFADEKVVDRSKPIYGAINMTNRTSRYINSGEHPWLVIQSGNRTNYDTLFEERGISLQFVPSDSSNVFRSDWEPVIIDWLSEIGVIPGGYIDLVRGVLVKTWDMGTLTGTGTWNETRNGLYYTSQSGVMRQSDYRGHLIADIVPTSAVDNNLTAGYPSITAYRASSSYPGRNWIYVSVDPTVIDTTTKFKEWLGENNIQYAYEMATPVEYPIDPVTLKTIRGLNNIWSSANGNIELSYWTH